MGREPLSPGSHGGVTVWMGTQAAGGRLAPARRAARAARLPAPRCSPARLRNPHLHRPRRGARGDRTPRPLWAHFLEVLPRRAGSHPRARSLPEFSLVARLPRAPRGDRPARGSPLDRAAGKPRELPRGSAIPGNPRPGAWRKGPGLRTQGARQPPQRWVGDSARQLSRRGKGGPGAGGQLGKARPPPLPPAQSPRGGNWQPKP